MTLFLIISKWREILIGFLAFLLLICLTLLNHKAGQIEKYKQAEIILRAENANAKTLAALKEKQWSEQQSKAEQKIGFDLMNILYGRSF